MGFGEAEDAYRKAITTSAAGVVTVPDPEKGTISIWSLNSIRTGGADRSTAPIIFTDAIYTQYSDNHTINVNPEVVFGRSDPIYTYSNTQREITLGFTSPAVATGGAQTAFQKLADLIRVSYPVYKNRILHSPPLVEIEIGTFFRGIAYLGSVNFNYLNPESFQNSPVLAGNALIPQMFSVTLQIKPIHEKVLGFDSLDNGAWLGPTDFPFKTE
jgi:hypothetical protein